MGRQLLHSFHLENIVQLVVNNGHVDQKLLGTGDGTLAEQTLAGLVGLGVVVLEEGQEVGGEMFLETE